MRIENIKVPTPHTHQGRFLAQHRVWPEQPKIEDWELTDDDQLAAINAARDLTRHLWWDGWEYLTGAYSERDSRGAFNVVSVKGYRITEE